MKVELERRTPLDILVKAIRICKGGNKDEKSFLDDLTERDKDLIIRIIKNKHHSPLEHIVYTFRIEDISRLCLQELVRHRHASYSVKSTRYTLKKDLSNEQTFMKSLMDYDYDRVEKYLILQDCLAKSQSALLEMLRTAVCHNSANIDTLKYLIPESFKTSLYMTINARSLRNFFELRTDKTAHFEIRQLALKIFDALPENHEFMYQDVIKGD